MEDRILDALHDDEALALAADRLIEAGRRMDRFGWVPSYGGNISARLPDGGIAITRSGGRKGFLSRENVIRVDAEGRPARAGDRPSAETLLHCQIYAAFPGTGSVLHGHSVAATALSRAVADDHLPLAGYEMIKAFPGQLTHETTVRLPIFPNSQDMPGLAAAIAPKLPQDIPGYVLRGHGVYAWGRDVDDAMANLEAVEFLIACELEARKIGGR